MSRAARSGQVFDRTKAEAISPGKRPPLQKQITLPYIRPCGVTMVEPKGKAKDFEATTFGDGVEPRHGGQTKTGQRKTSRPLEPSLPLYLVLRSSRARGAWSLKRPTTEARVKETLVTLAKRHKIKIFEFVNGGDQLHLLVRAQSRPGFQAFLRAFAGLTARAVTGAKKGKPAGKFWDALTFSRVVAWGEEFDRISGWLGKGDLDVLSALSEVPRKRARAR
jgi:REP element-mobilizing transposase RayT